MTDFVRARSEEQKQARMAEIKAAADELFCSVPYQEITLSTIAGKLSWTRANLYKYVTTKEEIYLEICSDKMQSYFDDLFAAFPDEKPFTPDQWAAAWADVLNAHRDYLRYSDILCTIIEVHVTACRLASFKTSYHAHRDAGSEHERCSRSQIWKRRPPCNEDRCLFDGRLTDHTSGLVLYSYGVTQEFSPAGPER